jgi:hypothetical protein
MTSRSEDAPMPQSNAPKPVEHVVRVKRSSQIAPYLQTPQDDPYGFTHKPRTSSKL